MSKSKSDKRRASHANGASGHGGPADKNEGEGNKTAARRYDQAVQKTVESGEIPEKAREAERALDGPEGEELRRAERDAKRGPKPA